MDWIEFLSKVYYTAIGIGIGYILRDIKETVDTWLARVPRS